MPVSAFRLKAPITAVIRDGKGYRLRQLVDGSVIFATGSMPDQNGMIDGTCNGDVVLLYQRDLTESAEEIVSEMPTDKN